MVPVEVAVEFSVALEPGAKVEVEVEVEVGLEVEVAVERLPAPATCNVEGAVILPNAKALTHKGTTASEPKSNALCTTRPPCVGRAIDRRFGKPMKGRTGLSPPR